MTRIWKCRDARNILIVLGSAVVCAVLLASAFIAYYGPSGSYVAGNTLFDPAIIKTIRNQGEHLSPEGKGSIVFERLEFSYFDPKEKEMQFYPISLETYGKLYHKIVNEKSLLGNIKEIQSLFLHSRPAILSVDLQTKKGSGNKLEKISQVVEFLSDDYFRVQLREERGEEWGYFYHRGLYLEMIKLATQSQTL